MAESSPDFSATADPVIWIVSTGTEILQGHYADANAPWLGAQLLAMGLTAQRILALPDHDEPLRAGLSEASRQADLVLTTGGLGPTVDDLNREIIAGIWGAPLTEDLRSWEMILERFRKRGTPVSESNRVQALIPLGAVVLHNAHGTAPGFLLHAPGVRATILALPGPLREMQPMFAGQAAPLLAERFARGKARRRTLTFHTTGLAESRVNDCVRDLFARDPQVNFALLAQPGKVDIRLTLMGSDEQANEALARQWRALVRERVGGEHIYGEDAMTLEEADGKLLRRAGQTLACAESCTGGMLAARLTRVPGASDYFKEGFVTYANEAKTARLNVDPALLEKHGAVSAETAEAMARGAQRAAASDWALSLTGIAGPGGGSEEKPVGLVYLGLAQPSGKAETQRRLFIGDREDIRNQACQAALDWLRREMLNNEQ